MQEYTVKFFETLFSDTTPLWVQIWVGWMMVINTASVLFLTKRIGRVVFVVWNLNGITMLWLFANLGYNRLLGLSHVIWWTPLLIYLWKVRKDAKWPIFYRRWYEVLSVTIGLSLILDYLDVLRYLLL